MFSGLFWCQFYAVDTWVVDGHFAGVGVVCVESEYKICNARAESFPV